MYDAFILSGCRTAIGRFQGGLAEVPAVDLGATVVAAAVEQAQIEPHEVDEVVLGCVLSGGLKQAPARQAALGAGLPPTVGALTINKVCGSGLEAATRAAQAVHCGDAQIVVAGGMECMSRAGYVLHRDVPVFGDRRLIDLMQHDGLTCATTGLSMGEIAEDLAVSDGWTREDLDRYALESHRRACAAEAVFREEIVPVVVEQRGESSTLDRDEGPRPNTSLERLATLPAVFREGGRVTAGNSSIISDGAAALVIGSEQAAKRHHLEPVARIVASATAGVPPEDLFIAPVDAIRDVVAKAGRTLDEVDLFELNEAFASQMLACLRRLDLPQDRVNVHGGAIALGHPIGASGARILVTLLNALRVRNQRVGVASLCLGGGNAVAMLIERC